MQSVHPCADCFFLVLHMMTYDTKHDQQLFPWGDGRRYNSYKAYMQRIFGGRVQKISVDAGFSCPNRDGTKGRGGCSFCSNDAFNPSYCQPEKSISQQIQEGISFHQKRYRRAEKYLVYFQAYSNTYKPLDELKAIYAEALNFPAVAGIVIGTRPDTVDEAILDYLQQLSRHHYVKLEYGVESVYDKTLQAVNRGHSFQDAVKAIHLTAEKGLPVGIHLIFGLPGETPEMMLHAASVISELPITSVKFHQLQIFKQTAMAADFLQHPDAYQLFSLYAYIDFVVDFTSRLRPDIIIERFAGEVPPRFLVTPPWENLRYDQVLQLIEQRMEMKNSWQGKFFAQLSSDG